MKKEKNLYYEKRKSYYYSVYDLNDFELNIASFEDLEELTSFINRITSGDYKKEYISVLINKHCIIDNRYEIIRDKTQTLDAIEF